MTGCSTAIPTLRTWTYLKNQLSFCRVTQDGDDEGCLRLFDLPTPEQAVLIRKAIGLKRRTSFIRGNVPFEIRDG